MNFEKFQEIMEQHANELAAREFDDAGICMHPVLKTNSVKHGMTIDGQTVSPTVYLEDLYEEYQRTGDIEMAKAQLERMLVDGMRDRGDIPIPDFSDEKLLEQLSIQLVNTDMNREMLQSVPHREVHDLSVVYRVVMGQDKSGGVMSALITNTVMERMGLEPSSLHDLAMDNMNNVFRPVVKPLVDVMKGLMMQDGMPEEMADIMVSEHSDDLGMYVITNDAGLYGAGTMLNQDLMSDLAEQVQDDLFILPSSVHECLAISASDRDAAELAEMVFDVNMGEVALEDRLSNQVYFFDRNTRELSMATDVPLRIDGTEIAKEVTPVEKKQAR